MDETPQAHNQEQLLADHSWSSTSSTYPNTRSRLSLITNTSDGNSSSPASVPTPLSLHSFSDSNDWDTASKQGWIRSNPSIDNDKSRDGVPQQAFQRFLDNSVFDETEQIDWTGMDLGLPIQAHHLNQTANQAIQARKYFNTVETCFRNLKTETTSAASRTMPVSGPMASQVTRSRVSRDFTLAQESIPRAAQSPQARRETIHGRQGPFKSDPRNGDPVRARQSSVSTDHIESMTERSISKSPETTQPKTGPNSRLESRIESVLDSIHSAGFDSLESFVAEYFTADLDEDSSTKVEQSLSRSRHLRGLLSILRMSSESWSARESQGFNDEIIRSAEVIYTKEVQCLTQNLRNSNVAPTSLPEGEKSKSRLLEEFVASLDFNGQLSQSKRKTQEEVSVKSFTNAVIQCSNKD
ncbi:hypothetical protein MMC25_008161 [Agyrium rufum]|nr:hypothetical protein [Agyrium rufum]